MFSPVNPEPITPVNPEPEPITPVNLHLGEDSGTVGTDDDSPPETTTTSSSAGSIDRRGLKAAIVAAIRMVTRLANDTLTRTELEREHGLYIADEEDEEGIADPAAAILHRHGGIGGAGNPDVGDAIRGLIAFAVYVAKQLTLRRDLRRAHAAAGDEQPETPAA